MPLEINRSNSMQLISFESDSQDERLLIPITEMSAEENKDASMQLISFVPDVKNEVPPTSGEILESDIHIESQPKSWMIVESYAQIHSPPRSRKAVESNIQHESQFESRNAVALEMNPDTSVQQILLEQNMHNGSPQTITPGLNSITNDTSTQSILNPDIQNENSPICKEETPLEVSQDPLVQSILMEPDVENHTYLIHNKPITPQLNTASSLQKTTSESDIHHVSPPVPSKVTQEATMHKLMQLERDSQDVTPEVNDLISFEPDDQNVSCPVSTKVLTPGMKMDATMQSTSLDPVTQTESPLRSMRGVNLEANHHKSISITRDIIEHI